LTHIRKQIGEPTHLPILRLQKIDRETFNFSMPYFYLSPSPKIVLLIYKVLYLH